MLWHTWAIGHTYLQSLFCSSLLLTVNVFQNLANKSYHIVILAGEPIKMLLHPDYLEVSMNSNDKVMMVLLKMAIIRSTLQEMMTMVALIRSAAWSCKEQWRGKKRRSVKVVSTKDYKLYSEAMML